MVRLHFTGPFPLVSESEDVLGSDCPYRDEAGIYLWAVKTARSGYVCTYVGETSRSFYARTKEHAIQTLGGNYEILDAAAMVEGYVQEVWKGLWRKGTRDRLPEYLGNLPRLTEAARRFLLAQEVFLAPCRQDKRVRRRIEGAMAQSIRAAAPALLPSDVRYWPRLPSEEPFSVSLTCDKPVVGVPATLEA